MLATLASLTLGLAIAAPAAASPPERSSYGSHWAGAGYRSSIDPYAQGAYYRLTIAFSVGDTRTSDGRATYNFVEIFAEGWENTTSVVFIRPWEGGYFLMSTPEDPSLGGVDESLARAWLDAGPLTFVCYQGPCPSSMPAEISVTASFAAIGAQTVTPSHPVDDIGAVSSMVYRRRPATVSFEITGGSLEVPSIPGGAFISAQVQIYRAPTGR